VRKIFLYNAAFIIGRGLLWGNILGLGLGFLQAHFKIVSLDQASYYVPYVPVDLAVFPVLMLNIGTLLLCLLFLIIPSYIVTKVSPVKAIRWE
jgi:lipoprotein-releasing system permease protein